MGSACAPAGLGAAELAQSSPARASGRGPLPRSWAAAARHGPRNVAGRGVGVEGWRGGGVGELGAKPSIQTRREELVPRGEFAEPRARGGRGGTRTLPDALRSAGGTRGVARRC